MKADTMSDEAIRSGYKRTEIGEIPKDWEIKAFGELFDFLPTSSLPRNSLSDSGDIYYIHYGDIHTKWDYHLDFGTATVPLIASKKVTNAARLRDGDLIMVDASEDEEGVGKSVEVVNLGNRVAVAGLHTLALRSKERFLANGFKAYLQANEMVKAQIRRIATGLKVFGISKNSLTGLLLPLPGRVEQSAIAEALSDVDALLDALDRLIAKKRAIKQGTMQALLTGRVRLPGFSGNWEVRHLGEVADIKTGERNNEDKVEGGEYPFFVRSQTVERIDTYSFDGEAILVPGEGGIGSIFHYISGKFDYHQRVYKISNFSGNVTGKFIYYTMVYGFHSQATRHSVKATVDSLRLPTFQRYEFASPSASEQRAIAQVLFDMDAEIDALEKRRAKLRDIKQGMMQELLTGRIRLVQPQEQAQEASI